MNVFDLNLDFISLISWVNNVIYYFSSSELEFSDTAAYTAGIETKVCRPTCRFSAMRDTKSQDMMSPLCLFETNVHIRMSFL